MPPLPPPREALLRALAAETFDLLVVGGGITGCGVARDAALRGLRVALVEKDDFASGTSSRSSRLVHGGVRYLEHGHLHLVFEASAERRRLLRLAPHLVRPLAFTWPVYAGARIARWKLAAGLTLYDLLALFRNVAPHRTLDARGVRAAEPALRAEGLRGGARYFDAATDDARLTLANALGALEAGAVVVNHAAAIAPIRDGARVVGVHVRDAIGGGEIAVRARVVVGATGPWGDVLREHAARAPVRGSKGVHIAVPRERVGNRGALTLLSPVDGRVTFLLPAGAFTIIGTTDSYTTVSPDDVRATADDVRYLLDGANAFFPDARLTSDDVVSTWAGIRPLLPATGDTPGAASREHVVVRGADGMVAIHGGKLTTYRVMAADAVRAVLPALGRAGPGARGRSPTRDAPLPGGEIPSLDAAVRDAERATGDAALARHLAEAFGGRWASVWAEITRDDAGRRPLAPGLPYTVGELRWCVRHELAHTLADLLVRRTHLAFETRDAGRAAARIAAGALGWGATEIAEYDREVGRIFGIEGAEVGG